jgi:NADP-dependent 3-hydroxy acid dehydrogenase YdfG
VDVWKFCEAERSTVIDVCRHGAWRTVDAVLSQMIERERGSIVLNSSLAGVEGAATVSRTPRPQSTACSA